MATTGIVNGRILRIYVDDAIIDNETECALSVSHTPRTSTNKDDGGWQKTLPGSKSWEASGSGEHEMTTSGENYSTLFGAMIAGTEVKIDFDTAVTGDKKYTGNAQITSLEISSSSEENVTFSYTFTGNGALTESTNAI